MMFNLKRSIFSPLSLLLLVVALIVPLLHYKYNYDTENEYLLTSEAYTRYRERLSCYVQTLPTYEYIKKEGKTPFEKATKRLLTLIEGPLPKPDDLQRRKLAHRQLVSVLRRLSSYYLSNKDLVGNEGDAKNFILEVVRYCYLNDNIAAELYPSLLNHVEDLDHMLSSYLTSAQELLHRNPQFAGIKSHPHDEDHFLHGNIPWRVARCGSLDVIRMGKPISRAFRPQAYLFKPAIAAEFLLFISSQPAHLYINLMQRSGSEGYDTRAIEELESIYPEVYVATLDKNSDFYWQKKSGELIDSEQFIEQFLTNLTAEGGDYRWPRRLSSDKKTWRQELKQIIDNNWKILFAEKALLDRRDRLDLIELSYISIIQKLCEQCTPTSINISCNQAIDRAPGLIALWMYSEGRLSDKEVAALIMLPPLLVHNRPPHKSRIDRLSSAIQRIETLSLHKQVALRQPTTHG